MLHEVSNHLDLRHLKISIPSSYIDGVPEGYFYKSIFDIIQDGDMYEILMLNEWVCRQLLDHIGWTKHKELTVQIIKDVLNLFEVLSIKPTECIYDAPKPKKESE